MYPEISKVLELLYPRKCPICDGVLSGKEPFICRKCVKKIRFLKEPLCFRCGKPLLSQEQEYCFDCKKSSHNFERGFAPFSYRGPLQASMMRFKYGGRAEYAQFYARAIAGYGMQRIKAWKPDCLIPVPIHRSRRLKRGYNQAEKIASELSLLCKIPVNKTSVLRIKNTRAQKELNHLQRKRNLEQAFILAAGYRPPHCILLIDDIYTTGSTVDALASLLKKQGAQKIYFACVCISPGGS